MKLERVSVDSLPWILSSELAFTLQEAPGEILYTVENQSTGECFRIGEQEYKLLQFFKETHSSEEAAKAFEPRVAKSVIEFAVHHKLLKPANSSYSTNNTSPQPLDLAFLKLKLGNPQATIERIFPWAKWLTHPISITCWVLLTSLTLGYAWVARTTLTNQLDLSFSSHQPFLFFLSWAMLRFFHELGHALWARRWNVPVTEMGIVFVLFFPLTYVKANKTHTLSSYWQKTSINLGGIYVELLLACGAFWVWFNTAPGIVHSLAYSTFITGSIATLLFNGNPLMRFDGYYVLSDSLKIDNLYTKGVIQFGRVIKRFLLGYKHIQAYHWGFVGYGLACFIWRLVVMAGLIVTASYLFKGLGLLISIISVVLWYVLPGIKLFKSWKDKYPQDLSFKRSTLPRLGITLAAITLVLVIPYSKSVNAPVVLFDNTQESLSSELSGFVEQTLITTPQQVSQGQTLLTMSNPDEHEKLMTLQKAIEGSQLEADYWLSKGDFAARQKAQEKITQYTTLLDIQQKQLNSLTLIAPSDGVAIPLLSHIHEAEFIPAGQPLFQFQNEHKELVATAYLSLKDNKPVQESSIKAAEIQLNASQKKYTATSFKTIPYSGRELPHPSLSSLNGGNIDVMVNQPQQLTNPIQAIKLNIQLPSGSNYPLGSTGRASIYTREKTNLYWTFYDFFTNIMSKRSPVT